MVLLMELYTVGIYPVQILILMIHLVSENLNHINCKHGSNLLSKAFAAGVKVVKILVCWAVRLWSDVSAIPLTAIFSAKGLKTLTKILQSVTTVLWLRLHTIVKPQHCGH